MTFYEWYNCCRNLSMIEFYLAIAPQVVNGIRFRTFENVLRQILDTTDVSCTVRWLWCYCCCCFYDILSLLLWWLFAVSSCELQLWLLSTDAVSRGEQLAITTEPHLIAANDGWSVQTAMTDFL